MTTRQDEIYKFIREHIQKQGYPPTVREICQGCSISSTSTVGYHLQKLEDKGFIKRLYGSSRAIRLVGYRVELVPE